MTRSGRAGWVGVLLGAATLTKLYPAVLAPALLRRRPGIVAAAAIVVGVLAYLPHVLAVGMNVIGYLPGYLREEGYDSGRAACCWARSCRTRSTPLPAHSSSPALPGGCGGAPMPLRPSGRRRSWSAVAFLATTPSYGWYAGLLLALIVVSESYEWLPVVVAPMLTYHARGVVAGTVIYAVAAVLTLALNRYRHSDDASATTTPGALPAVGGRTVASRG